MGKQQKIANIGSECVACGCCVSVCPRAAISIDSGVTAIVESALCVGCGKCAATCPAAVITISDRREME